MTLRVIFDESHGEQLSSFNCKGLSFVLEKLNIVSYRLISGPITIDKISNEDLLFLGAPTQQFLEFELKTLEYFVSKGKFLVIVCPIPMPFNFALNELTIKFGIQFQHNVVQDKKHNQEGAMYFPIIRHFEKQTYTQDVKELVYSGCSLKQFLPDVRFIAFSDDDAEPPSAPVIATAYNDQVICIGGQSLFQDDKRYGIKAKNNIRFVANLFRSISQQKEQRSPLPKAEQPKAEQPKIKKLKTVDPKKAKKYFENLSGRVINELQTLMNDTDRLFDDILKIIESQNFSLAENTLASKYTLLKTAIQNKYTELIQKLDELDSRIEKDVNFPAIVKESTDNVLVVESDALSKLDMIRFNLSNRIKTEKLRAPSR